MAGNCGFEKRKEHAAQVQRRRETRRTTFGRYSPRDSKQMDKIVECARCRREYPARHIHHVNEVDYGGPICFRCSTALGGGFALEWRRWPGPRIRDQLFTTEIGEQVDMMHTLAAAQSDIALLKRASRGEK